MSEQAIVAGHMLLKPISHFKNRVRMAWPQIHLSKISRLMPTIQESDNMFGDACLHM